MTTRLAWVLAAAMLLSPAAAFAARRAAPAQTSFSGVRGSILVGFEEDVGPAAVAVRGDLELPLKPVSPAVGLSLVGSLGYSHWVWDRTRYYGYGLYPDYLWDRTVNVFSFVPALRFNFGRSPRFRPYADAGIGVYHASLTETWEEPVFDNYYGWYTTTFTRPDSETGLMFRFAAGLSIQLTDAFALGGEIGFTPYVGRLYGDTSTLMFGATFRL